MSPQDASSVGIVFHPWIVALALILGAAAFYAYYRTTPSVSGRLRWTLLALRAGAFALMCLILLDPRWVRHDDEREPARVIVMVDRSASMTLPETGWESDSGPTRFATARRLAEDVGARLDDRSARVEHLYFSKGITFASGDSVRPDGQGTDVSGSIQSALSRYEGENVTAVVVVSDGVDTEERLLRASAPGIPVFAIGLGDTAAPEDVRIREVDYSSFVRVPSRANVSATLAYTGSARKRVTLRLTEGSRNIFERDTVLVQNGDDVKIDIPLRFTEPGRREFSLSVDVVGYDAEEDNNRRDIVIEAEKAKAKIAIVDLQPDWELHFLTDYLRRDQTFDFDVIAGTGRQAPVRGRIKRADGFVAALAECDAVVLVSVSEEFLNDRVASAITQFVIDRGGGLLVLPGRSSLFEHAAAWGRFGDVLPLRGSPPFRFNIQYTSVLPGAQAAGNPITANLLPLFGQSEWQERSPLLGFYGAIAPVNVGEVLLSVKGRSLPAVTYRTVGKGRVAAVSAGPLWRWKFLSDNEAVYDEIISRMLDVLSRGEETDRFVMTTKKNVFETGESPVVYAELLNEKMQPVTGVPVRVEITRLDAGGAETPLDMVSMSRESADNPRFAAELAPLPPGRYLLRGHAELPDRPITSKPMELRISETSVEFARTAQNQAALAMLARRSGGAYGGVADVAAMADRINVDPRTVTTVTEMTLRTSLLLFALVLGLLCGEWILRKRAGLI